MPSGAKAPAHIFVTFPSSLFNDLLVSVVVTDWSGGVLFKREYIAGPDFDLDQFGLFLRKLADKYVRLAIDLG
jgi:hypothetical protein